MTVLQALTCAHGGAILQGRIALPDTPGPHPAVMVMHNAHGLGDHMLRTAQRLAQLGYVAVATDMYGGGIYHSDPQAAGASLAPLWQDPPLLRSRVVAWHELLKARPDVAAERIAAIGYCFGGQCVLELARSGADLQAVVSYHGILTTSMPAIAGAVKAHVAVYTGALDPYAPREHVEALRDEMVAAGARWQITVFGEACHAFTDPNAAATPLSGLAYDPLADRISWAGTEALLQTLLQARGGVMDCTEPC
jgi:dienelactone hydrolase